VSPVKYEIGFYIPADDILHNRRCGNFRRYRTNLPSSRDLYAPNADSVCANPGQPTEVAVIFGQLISSRACRRKALGSATPQAGGHTHVFCFITLPLGRGYQTGWVTAVQRIPPLQHKGRGFESHSKPGCLRLLVL
jgi:hypothetical protein